MASDVKPPAVLQNHRTENWFHCHQGGCYCTLVYKKALNIYCLSLTLLLVSSFEVSARPCLVFAGRREHKRSLWTSCWSGPPHTSRAREKGLMTRKDTGFHQKIRRGTKRNEFTMLSKLSTVGGQKGYCGFFESVQEEMCLSC